MKSNEERISLLHQRADKIRHERDKNRMIASGSVCALLLAVIVTLAAQFEKGAVGAAESMYMASSLLSENTGGFVLTGVIAFMAGVIITVIIKKHLDKKAEK